MSMWQVMKNEKMKVMMMMNWKALQKEIMSGKYCQTANYVVLAEDFHAQFQKEQKFIV